MYSVRRGERGQDEGELRAQRGWLFVLFLVRDGIYDMREKRKSEKNANGSEARR